MIPRVHLFFIFRIPRLDLSSIIGFPTMSIFMLGVSWLHLLFYPQHLMTSSTLYPHLHGSSAPWLSTLYLRLATNASMSYPGFMNVDTHPTMMSIFFSLRFLCPLP